MPKYDAQTIEREFEAAASARIKRKERSGEEYNNDASYWTGGRCNWDANHNLS